MAARSSAPRRTGGRINPPANAHRTRLTLSLAFWLGLCLAVAAGISFQLESRQARDEVKQKADLLLETGLAIRAYTSEEVAPTLLAAAGSPAPASRPG